MRHSCCDPIGKSIDEFNAVAEPTHYVDGHGISERFVAQAVRSRLSAPEYIRVSIAECLKAPHSCRNLVEILVRRLRQKAEDAMKRGRAVDPGIEESASRLVAVLEGQESPGVEEFDKAAE